jgi:hypothetical protein
MRRLFVILLILSALGINLDLYIAWRWLDSRKVIIGPAQCDDDGCFASAPISVKIVADDRRPASSSARPAQ